VTGDDVKAIRKRLQLSPEHFGGVVGCSTTMIRRWENYGPVNLPSYVTLKIQGKAHIMEILLHRIENNS
jgi:DNA-binding transcriptional regulator YiaG